ncbi:MAG: hypothetical protein AMJ54_04970 [Deltaproteobacteria bacterium SG8_13]|nr:MAG: hypothetical protein AMJ54_04970 [Deltaproteobacteria bacterium SG8_13]
MTLFPKAGGSITAFGPVVGKPGNWQMLPLTASNEGNDHMAAQTKGGGEDLKCPECRATLKRRRARTARECEMICGGCGREFDICDTQTVESLKEKP